MSHIDKEQQSNCCSEEQYNANETTNSCCSGDNRDQINDTSSCCSTAENTRIVQEEYKEVDDEQNVVEYNIRGMDCPSCAVTIEKGLRKTDGIQTVQVNYGTGKMAVGAEDPSIYSTIPKQVRKLGFEAAPVHSNISKETYKIEGMDCGSCAKTIENHLSKNPNVHTVRVNFSTGNMQIEHAINSKDIVKEVRKAGFGAGLVSSEPNNKQADDKKMVLGSATTLSGIFLALGVIASFANLVPSLPMVLYGISILIGGFKPARSAFYAIKSRSLDMNVLMASAAIGAAFIGEWFEGAMVVWLFALGNTLQSRSIERTRDSIRSLMNLTPSEATVKSGNQLIRKAVKEVEINDIIIVKPGEKIPLDGEILTGISSVNQAPITGESLPVEKQLGDTVYAGTVNENGSMEIKVTKLVEDTTIAKIIHLVEEAQEQRAPTQAYVDRFASVYTPIVFVLALSVMVFPPLFGFGTWGGWLYKGLALLVVACPCALVISTPVAIVSAIGNAAKRGVLIKGGTFLEKAGVIQAIAFDKTGTLTEGKPKVTEVITLNENRDELIAIARTIEEYSTHPIAKAITTYAKERDIPAKNGEAFQAIAGKGAQATIDGVQYFAGSPKLFREMDVSLEQIEEQIHALQGTGNTMIVIGTHKNILGIIAVADTIRDITVNSIKTLKEVGMNEMVMLTGDNEETATKIANDIGIDRYFAELLPEDKVSAIKKLQSEGKRVAMVGDGINDAPALATADLGIAMGGAGTDTAMETADIVLMADNLEKLPHTIRLSRRALSIIKQNIWFSVVTKLAALILIFPGFLTLWMAVLSDTGAALIVILNSMRLLRQK
ncbi:heavy metal translocating P-type ATPase [Pontibacillus yanchengensis]|uniref:Cd(2+)-exporting ATPase n=1 Tax=Pontibacillus yanchengensis Y32 TaxID=1385514 RepID=A0A0A2TB68_9BACI|nr:heavy metal translocating P-type ATPase [Pontibacillus yanchengensis]KGP71668.1 ATPase [Pontibacillus yanchengensis Y32]